MYADLFFDIPDARDLVEASIRVFGALGAKNYEQRDSSSYLGGLYFMAEIEGVQIEIALADDEEAGDLRFWLSVESSLAHDVFEQVLDQRVIENLRGAGARLARVHDFGKNTMRVVAY